MLISQQYIIENEQLHIKDNNYGAEGHLWAYHVAGIATLEGCRTILDYGCGKGTLALALLDFTSVKEYDPGVPSKSSLPSPSDLVVSLDVLEHIEPACMEEVLLHLKQLTKKLLFVVICTKDSKRRLSNGKDTHLSKHDGVWWTQTFINHGWSIKREWNTDLRLWIALLQPTSS